MMLVIIGLLVPAAKSVAEPAVGTNATDGIIPVPLSGKVIETTNAAGYTYLLVQHGSLKSWAACQQFKVAVGDEVKIPQGWTMKDFKSPTLNRSFDWILFAAGVEVAGQTGGAAPQPLPPGHPQLPPNHPAITPGKTNAGLALEVKKGSVQKAQGGRTVEEFYSKKKELAGKTVKVRGVVVKFNSSILGKNWIHIRDGTGGAGTSDLTITTAETVKVGDTIVAEGKIGYNRKFGSGYDYDVLLEDAVISK